MLSIAFVKTCPSHSLNWDPERRQKTSVYAHKSPKSVRFRCQS